MPPAAQLDPVFANAHNVIEPNGAYLLAAKNLFLTYPRDDTDPQQRLEEIVGKLIRFETDIRVAQEDHDDGGKHLHVFIHSNTKIQTRDARYFDFNGHHPNVQTARSPSAVLDYVSKGGNFFDHGDPQQHANKKKSWKDVLKAPNRLAFLEMAQSVSPRDYVLQHERILAFGDKHYRVEIPPYQGRPLTEFSYDNYVDIVDWITQMNIPGNLMFIILRDDLIY